MEIKGIFT